MILGTLALAALLPACAGAPPPPPAPPATPVAPTKPLPRSSIAAVVLHRGELGLTDEQIETMERRDREREDEERALRAEDDKRKKAVDEAARNAQNTGPSGRAPGGMRGGGMRGAGMGAPPPGGHFPDKPRGPSLDDRLDANDTKAYLDIEDVLTPAQRESAREIASDYRAQLYDRREQQKQAQK